MKKLFYLSFLLVFFYATSEAKNKIQKEQKILIQTTAGDVTLKLYNETPLHRDNFIKLVKNKFYDGLIFHRVISEFMIQGGDPNSKNAATDAMLGEGDVEYKIPAEFKTPQIFHKKGVLAAAREGDNVNPEKASSGCQFYIVVGKIYTDKELDLMQLNRKQKNRSQYLQQMMDQKQNNAENLKNAQDSQKLKLLKDSIMNQLEMKMKVDTNYIFTKKQRETYKTIGGTPHLDGNYTVFGEVLKGMEIVEKISKVKTNPANRPTEDVKILNLKLIK